MIMLMGGEIGLLSESVMVVLVASRV